jgi:hypothetical protein
MNNNDTPSNGVSFTLDGQRVNVIEGRSNDRVRIIRAAIARGASSIAVHVNGTTAAL